MEEKKNLGSKIEKLILDNLHHGIIAIDLNEKIIFINKEAEAIIGVKDSMVIGKSINKIIPESTLPKILVTKKPFMGAKIKIGDKEIIFSQNPLNIKGRLMGAVAIFYENRQTEEVIKELNEIATLNAQLNAIIESSYDGIFITDGKGVTVRVNSAYERITGLKAEEVIGRYMGDLVKDGVFDESVTLRVIETGKRTTLIQNVKTTGARVLVTGNPICEDTKIAWVVTNVRDITELNNLKRELDDIKEKSQRYETEINVLRSRQLGIPFIIGRSQVINNLIDKVANLALVDSTVLLCGESGVGKEVFAKAMHFMSPRNKGPFIKINCGAIPDTLFESELFGYNSGAFTGALKEGKPGLFELANNGTIFLDEISELPLALQVKVLRVLQEKEILRIGGTNSIKIDCRIIAASNKELDKMVSEGKFRKDLFYRINVVPLIIPPLRERKNDIFVLSQYFLDQYNKKYKKQKSLSQELMDAFMRYSWPGNVRELENIIERLVVLSNSDIIHLEHLPLEFACSINNFTGKEHGTLNQIVEIYEKQIIREILDISKNISEAAFKLGVERTTLSRKVKKYGLKLGN